MTFLLHTHTRHLAWRRRRRRRYHQMSADCVVLSSCCLSWSRRRRRRSALRALVLLLLSTWPTLSLSLSLQQKAGPNGAIKRGEKGKITFPFYLNSKAVCYDYVKWRRRLLHSSVPAALPLCLNGNQTALKFYLKNPFLFVIHLCVMYCTHTWLMTKHKRKNRDNNTTKINRGKLLKWAREWTRHLMIRFPQARHQIINVWAERNKR